MTPCVGMNGSKKVQCLRRFARHGLRDIAARGHVVREPHVAADGGATTQRDTTQDGRAGIDHHVVLDDRMARQALAEMAVRVRGKALGAQGPRPGTRARARR